MQSMRIVPSFQEVLTKVLFGIHGQSFIGSVSPIAKEIGYHRFFTEIVVQEIEKW